MSGVPVGSPEIADQAGLSVGIVPGRGVVVRFGPTIGVFGADAGPEEPFTAAWLQRLSRWSAGDTTSAETLAWQAVELLIAHRGTAPAWGTAIRIPGGYLMLLHGAVRAQIDAPTGRVELSGAQDLTWVDRRIADPISRIALSLTPSGDIVADPRSDLRAGLVPGGSGLVLTTIRPPRQAPPRQAPPRPTPPAPTPPGTPAPRVAAQVSGPAAGPVAGLVAGPAPGRVPVPVSGPVALPVDPLAARPVTPASPSPVAPRIAPGPLVPMASPVAPMASPVAPRIAPGPVAPMVSPVAPVPNWPANAPAGRAPTPSVTHPVSVERLDVLRPPPPLGQRPPAEETQAVRVTAGLLVADDGTRLILDRAYVLGRDPTNDPAVVRGFATPISIDDPDQLISRVQARITPAGGVVTVGDAGSANGTYIAPPGAREWTRIGSQPAVLPVGWSVRLGRRIYTHAAPDAQPSGPS